jgi:hypothetical protein
MCNRHAASHITKLLISSNNTINNFHTKPRNAITNTLFSDSVIIYVSSLSDFKSAITTDLNPKRTWLHWIHVLKVPIEASRATVYMVCYIQKMACNISLHHGLCCNTNILR